MSVMHSIGKLGLEGLMDRANIVFTNGYRFRGEIDENYFSQSIKAICNSISKFNYQLNFHSQDNFTWDNASENTYQLYTTTTTDLDLAFAQLSESIFSTFDSPQSEPMRFTLIKSKLDNEFIIAQSSSHTYVDARSAEVIFNNIVDYYNALCSNKAAAEDILTRTQTLHTESSDIIINKIFNENPNANHDKNVASIVNYAVEDCGQHAIPMHALDKALTEYRKSPKAPIIQYFSIDDLLVSCRKKHPDISKNSVICAAITKAIYAINVQEKGVSTNHLISFKMVSDILSKQMRQQYSGNYIAFVPVSVNGEKSLEDIAHDINCTVVDFKKNAVNTSVFSLTENAISEALVGTADDPLSFVVTNWSNYAFIADDKFLTNCQALRHQSGVNINPKDSLGAVLVNRPILVISFSPDGTLCISQFPSLSEPAVNENLAEHLNTVLLNKGNAL